MINGTSIDSHAFPWDKPGYRTNLEISILLTKISAMVSLLCSLILIYQIISKRHEKLKLMYHRIMLIISICDICVSSALFVGNWAIPRDLKEEWLMNNVGTQLTCNVQGFLFSFGIYGVATSIACLSLHFMFLIRYNWSQERLRPIEYSMWMLLIACLGVSLIMRDSYKPFPFFCWVYVSVQLHCGKK